MIEGETRQQIKKKKKKRRCEMVGVKRWNGHQEKINKPLGGLCA